LEAKEFAKCAELQARLQGIQSAMESRSITADAVVAAGGAASAATADGAAEPRGTAMTRAELDVRVLETQLRLADAEVARDFALCGQLQEALLALQGLRDQHPTAAEARAKAAKARTELEAAVARKDFRMCAELQSRVDEADAKAAALAKAEAAAAAAVAGGAADSGGLSRSELMKREQACRGELEAAQAARDFGRCVT
jgi:hypothetical protein